MSNSSFPLVAASCQQTKLLRPDISKEVLIVPLVSWVVKQTQTSSRCVARIWCAPQDKKSITQRSSRNWRRRIDN